MAACLVFTGCTTTPETPSVRITSPSNGATIQAGDIRIDTAVENFNIVDKQGQATVPGEGHVHFYMDVSPMPSAAGQPAIPANTSTLWAHVSDDTYTFQNVPPGVHTFAVQLVNNDHTPLAPVVSDTVTVTVTT